MTKLAQICRDGYKEAMNPILRRTLIGAGIGAPVVGALSLPRYNSMTDNAKGMSPFARLMRGMGAGALVGGGLANLLHFAKTHPSTPGEAATDLAAVIVGIM